jgi:release factor glutamine methyltransferase
LYAKENGLDIIQKLVKQSKKILSDKWIVALEFGWKQKEEIKEIIDKNYTNISYNFYKDYSGNWRFIIIKGKGENNEDIKNKN